MMLSLGHIRKRHIRLHKYSVQFTKPRAGLPVIIKTLFDSVMKY